MTKYYLNSLHKFYTKYTICPETFFVGKVSFPFNSVILSEGVTSFVATLIELKRRQVLGVCPGEVGIDLCVDSSRFVFDHSHEQISFGFMLQLQTGKAWQNTPLEDSPEGLTAVNFKSRVRRNSKNLH